MKRTVALLIGLFILLTPVSAFAHSKVTPGETGIAKDETFTATVENEKDIPTTNVRLVLPSGLDDVEIYAKSGWTINTVKDGDTTKEIVWSGGTIPKELIDSFTFNAKAPSQPTKLTWKIYQTYENGSTVAWANTDENAADKDGGSTGPASFTQVIDDLKQTPAPSQSSTSSTLALIFGLTGLIVAVAALFKRSPKS